MRKKLTDEERAERKRKAWDKNQFKKKQTSGNADQWKRAAEVLLSKPSDDDQFLKALGLSKMPESLTELKKARRLAMQRAHPDVGGSDAEAQTINAAYEQIAKSFK